jgi:lambda repressor-like predicted transcriptional regulator
MLTVAQYELIRRKVRVDGLSQRVVARELGHSRKTVKKALEQPVPPGDRRKQA